MTLPVENLQLEGPLLKLLLQCKILPFAIGLPIRTVRLTKLYTNLFRHTLHPLTSPTQDFRFFTEPFTLRTNLYKTHGPPGPPPKHLLILLGPVHTSALKLETALLHVSPQQESLQRINSLLLRLVKQMPTVLTLLFVQDLPFKD